MSMRIDRRTLLRSLAVCSLPLPGLLQGQEAVLPLRTPGLDHLDVMVPDVEASARFYMGLLNTTLYAQPFQGGFRYFVLLGELNERREVGYLAVGAARGRGSYIGHFCTTVFDWRRDSDAVFAGMEDAFAAAGFGAFPGSTGFGGIFTDPDGIEIQFLPAPDTLVTAAEPSQLVPWNQGLVTPRGLDHVLLRVSDMERALRYYEILYGPYRWHDGRQRASFEFPASATSLQLEQARYEYGQQPQIARFGLKVDAFDRDAVAAAVTELGATVLSAEEGAGLRLRDPDGNIVELNSV